MANLDPTRRDLTASLLQAGRQWRRAAEQAMAAHDISEALASPLIWIGRLGSGVRQIELAEHVGIEGPSLVRLLDQLESHGLVVRREDPKDRRAKNLSLTRQGKTLANKVEALLIDLRIEVLDGISQEDLQTALRVLGRFGSSTERRAP